jgi:hypothetical protein
MKISVLTLLGLACVILLACGPTASNEGPDTFKVRRLPPEQFDLLESAFHTSKVTAEVGERVEVVVEVWQQKDDQWLCGVPVVLDPFGNALQTLTPKQNPERETDEHYLYESGYAFFPAIDGDYSIAFENRECIAASIPATANVRWSVFASPR